MLVGIRVSFYGKMIHTGDIATKYQGIIIAPYIWSRRLDPRTRWYWLDPRTRWYYTWDCASGCIWDADAIQSIIPYSGDSNEGAPGTWGYFSLAG